MASLRSLTRFVAGSLFIAALCSCGTSTRKLDEALIYQGPHFSLKLVRYYENYPFHYTGEIFVVQCASQKTISSPARTTQESGWLELGRGGAIGSKTADEVAARERVNYLVLDDKTLVWLGFGINFSFDACGSQRSWYPWSLPAELIIPAEKPDYCAPKGDADCRHDDFMDDRTPRYKDISVTSQGMVSFTVQSKAFKENKQVRVKSVDFGKTWEMEQF